MEQARKKKREKVFQLQNCVNNVVEHEKESLVNCYKTRVKLLKIEDNVTHIWKQFD